MAGIPRRSARGKRLAGMDTSLLRGTIGPGCPTGAGSDVRVLLVLVVEPRPASPPLPRRRQRRSVPPGLGAPRSAAGRTGGALRECQALGGTSVPSGRSVVAL